MTFEQIKEAARSVSSAMLWSAQLDLSSLDLPDKADLTAVMIKACCNILAEEARRLSESSNQEAFNKAISDIISLIPQINNERN